MLTQSPRNASMRTPRRTHAAWVSGLLRAYRIERALDLLRRNVPADMLSIDEIDRRRAPHTEALHQREAFFERGVTGGAAFRQRRPQHQVVPCLGPVPRTPYRTRLID